MTVCLEEANRDSCQKDKLSLKTQPASPLQSVSNSPSKSSSETHSPRLTWRTVQADLPKPAGNENVQPKSTEKDKEKQFKGKDGKEWTLNTQFQQKYFLINCV